jgi:hypothetical protein
MAPTALLSSETTDGRVRFVVAVISLFRSLKYKGKRHLLNPSTKSVGRPRHNGRNDDGAGVVLFHYDILRDDIKTELRELR